MTNELLTPHNDIQELLAEHALGTLDGRQRVQVLTHIEQCTSCSEDLDSFVRTIDSISEATVELEPPLGFETAVLSRIEAERLRRTPSMRRRTPRIVAIAAAAALLISGGWALGASQSHSAPTASAVRVVEGQLYAGAKTVGAVYASSGAKGWMVVALGADSKSRPVNCSLVTKSGKTISIGNFATSVSGSSWWAKLPVPLNQIREITLRQANGATYANSQTSRWASKYTNVSTGAGSMSHSV
jgi:hypothetical protein